MPDLVACYRMANPRAGGPLDAASDFFHVLLNSDHGFACCREEAGTGKNRNRPVKGLQKIVEGIHQRYRSARDDAQDLAIAIEQRSPGAARVNARIDLDRCCISRWIKGRNYAGVTGQAPMVPHVTEESGGLTDSGAGVGKCELVGIRFEEIGQIENGVIIGSIIGCRTYGILNLVERKE
jgi:hypothetical protein